jgi:hypothetical protein
MMIKSARVAAVADTTKDAFFVFPIQNPDSAAASAGVPDDPELCPLAITDGEGTFYAKGLELQYDQKHIPTVDIAVMITVPNDWIVVAQDNATSWSRVEDTNSYVTVISKDVIQAVIENGGEYDDPFIFEHVPTGLRHDPAVRVTRPPSNSKDTGER